MNFAYEHTSRFYEVKRQVPMKFPYKNLQMPDEVWTGEWMYKQLPGGQAGKPVDLVDGEILDSYQMFMEIRRQRNRISLLNSQIAALLTLNERMNDEKDG